MTILMNLTITQQQHLSQPSMTRWPSDDTFSVTESEGSLSPTSPRLRLKDFKVRKNLMPAIVHVSISVCEKASVFAESFKRR